MKYLLLALIVASNLAVANDVYVQPYTRSDGTQVQGHYRTAPDNSQYNNYSTQGNTNPYTGQQGTVQPQPNYGAPTSPQPSNRGQSATCLYGQRC